jgi:hypothetical protein
MVESSGIISDETYEKNIYVQKSDAILRSKFISNVNYTVKLLLLKGETYSGSVTISFELTNPTNDDLYLDFRGLKIANYSVNKTV